MLRLSNGAGGGRSHRRTAAPPENIHYFPSGNDLWGRLLSGDHSAHHHSGHLDGSHGLGGGDGEAGEMAVVAASAIEGAPELKDQRFDLAQLPLFGFTPV